MWDSLFKNHEEFKDDDSKALKHRACWVPGEVPYGTGRLHFGFLFPLLGGSSSQSN